MGLTFGETERGFDKRPNRIERQPIGMAANLATMRHHAVRPYSEEKVTDKVSIAFLARAPIKFADHLLSESVVTRRETLGTMSRWLIAHPKNKAAQVDAQAVPILTELLSDEDVEVREGASLVLSQLATLYHGVQDMLRCQTVERLLVAVLDEHSSKIRNYAHTCLHLVGEYPDGSQAMVQAGGTKLLVKECSDRPSAETLMSLGHCLKNPTGLLEAIEFKANKVMVSCLSHSSPPVLQHACKNLSSLTIEMEAKDEAIAEGAIPALVPLLKHEMWPVRSAATCALMSITIAVEGKKQANNCGAIALLTGLLADQNKSVVLYAVRCLGNLAELKRETMLTPDDNVYKATFERAVPQLKIIMGNQDRVMAKSARDTADLIRWRP